MFQGYSWELWTCLVYSFSFNWFAVWFSFREAFFKWIWYFQGSMNRLLYSNFWIFQAFEHLDLAFFLMIIGALISGSNLFLYCYFGHIATDCYLSIADCIYESKWYNQEKILQKFFLIIIQNAQQPFYYHGFGVARLNLNTYRTVWGIIFQFFNDGGSWFTFVSDVKNGCQLLHDVQSGYGEKLIFELLNCISNENNWKTAVCFDSIKKYKSNWKCIATKV